jgi:hypothetical protein
MGRLCKIDFSFWIHKSQLATRASFSFDLKRSGRQTRAFQVNLFLVAFPRALLLRLHTYTNNLAL